MPRRQGRVVVLHLAAQYPFAGIFWQLLHHLEGLRRLGLDVYYIEDHGAWTYDPVAETSVANPKPNVRALAAVLDRFGFGDRWAFFDSTSNDYLGIGRDRSRALLAEADAVFNLCTATRLREEHLRARCLVDLQTDPGGAQLALAANDPEAIRRVETHHLHFTYAENIGKLDCRLPTGGVNWRPTRPPVLTDEWLAADGNEQDPEYFSTVCTWHNQDDDGNKLDGEVIYWSKDLNFRRCAKVPRRSGQPIKIASDLKSGSDYERMVAGGFTIIPAVPMSLDLDKYRRFIGSSRGEFTASKDLYVRTRSGWFSDRSVCYLAAGRPVVTQGTGFEKYLPTGCGLFDFDEPAQAVEAIKAINADYAQNCRAARAIAVEYFEATKVLDEIAEAAGL